MLDFFDTYARRQSASPLMISLLIPLLRLSRAGGELANKAAGILRTRIAKALHAPSPSAVDTEEAASVLAEIHDLAQHASSAEFSSLCSAASLYVARAAQPQAQAAYTKTLEDFMTRKSSAVHPAFILDYASRFPAKAWALAPTLINLCAPGKSTNAYRQTQGYGVLQALFRHLHALVKAGDVSEAEATRVLKSAMAGAYDTFEAAADGGEYKADRLKDVAKFALAVARAAKSLDVDVDAGRLAGVVDKVKEGKTKEMKSVHGLLKQLGAVLGKDKDKSGKKVKEVVDEEEKVTPQKRKAVGEVKAGKKTKAKKAKAT